MQREILNVAKACQLPGFRYVRFAPVPILARPRQVESAAQADPTPEAMPPAEIALPDAMLPVTEQAAPVFAAAPPVLVAPVPTAASAMRQFALLTEMTQSLASRPPQRPQGRLSRGSAAEQPPLAPPVINRSRRGAQATAQPADPGHPPLPVAERALLAEVTATLQRRRPTEADLPPAERPRSSRTP